MKSLQNGERTGAAQTTASKRIPAAHLPERLPWPAAALIILGISLLLWFGLGTVAAIVFGG